MANPYQKVTLPVLGREMSLLPMASIDLASNAPEFSSLSHEPSHSFMERTRPDFSAVNDPSIFQHL
jgi:hypothetical protein